MIKVIQRKRKNGVYLYLDIYYKRQRTTKATGFKLTGNSSTDKRIMQQAEKAAARMTIKLSENDFNLNSIKKNGQDFLDFFSKLITDHPEHKFKKYALLNLQKFTYGKLLFSDMDEDFWKRFKRYMEMREFKPNTITHTLYILKFVLNQAVKNKYIPSNPLKGVRGKVYQSDRRFLTFKEVAKLRVTDCLENPEIKDAFLFSCYTGLRLSDIERLTRADIRDGSIRMIQKKTKDLVTIPLNPDALILLEERPGTGRLFNLPNRTVMSKVVRYWTKSAGVEDVTFHCARHTFATLALNANMRLEVVSSVLGHSDLKTTKIYAKLLDAAKKEDMKKFPNFG
jgi:integrase